MQAVVVVAHKHVHVMLHSFAAEYKVLFGLDL